MSCVPFLLLINGRGGAWMSAFVIGVGGWMLREIEKRERASD